MFKRGYIRRQRCLKVVHSKFEDNDWKCSIFHTRREGTWNKKKRKGGKAEEAWLLQNNNGGRELSKRGTIKNKNM